MSASPITLLYCWSVLRRLLVLAQTWWPLVAPCDCPSCWRSFGAWLCLYGTLLLLLRLLGGRWSRAARHFCQTSFQIYCSRLLKVVSCHRLKGVVSHRVKSSIVLFLFVARDPLPTANTAGRVYSRVVFVGLAAAAGSSVSRRQRLGTLPILISPVCRSPLSSLLLLLRPPSSRGVVCGRRPGTEWPDARTDFPSHAPAVPLLRWPQSAGTCLLRAPSAGRPAPREVCPLLFPLTRAIQDSSWRCVQPRTN